MKFLEIFFIVGLEAIPVNFETTEFSTTSTMRVLTDHPFETTIFTTGQILTKYTTEAESSTINYTTHHPISTEPPVFTKNEQTTEFYSITPFFW